MPGDNDRLGGTSPMRWYLAAVGFLVGVVGLVFLVVVPMSARDSAGTSVRCGTAVKRDEQAWADYDLEQRTRALEATLDPVTGKMTGPGDPVTGGYVAVTPPNCDAPIGQRRLWTISLVVAGFVVLVGAVLTAPPGYRSLGQAAGTLKSGQHRADPEHGEAGREEDQNLGDDHTA